jgi:hypothetical protein
MYKIVIVHFQIHMHGTLKLSWDPKEKKKKKLYASTSIFVNKNTFDCPNENFQITIFNILNTKVLP